MLGEIIKIIAMIVYWLLCAVTSVMSIKCGYSINSIQWWIFCGSVWIAYFCGNVIARF